MTWHILYVSYEENGRDYIGAHSTTDLNDGYLGSYKDKTFQPESRIIIGYYKTRESLIRAEGNLQRSLNVAMDPQYVNRSIQTSTGFDRHGVKDPLLGVVVNKIVVSFASDQFDRNPSLVDCALRLADRGHASIPSTLSNPNDATR